LFNKLTNVECADYFNLKHSEPARRAGSFILGTCLLTPEEVELIQKLISGWAHENIIYFIVLFTQNVCSGKIEIY
jgi:hypothetical protein